MAGPFDDLIPAQPTGAPSLAGVQTIIPGQPKRENAPAGYRWSADGTTLEPIPGGPAEGRPGGNRKAEADLRKEFNALPEVKDFKSIRDSFLQIRALGKNPTAQNDIGLIFSYMKMLDPGSVVREGEFATAQNAAGIPDRIKNVWNKAVSGERLNDSQRAEMMNSAAQIIEQRRATFNQKANEYRGYATDYELDPDRIAKPFEGKPRDPKDQKAQRNVSEGGLGALFNIKDEWQKELDRREAFAEEQERKTGSRPLAVNEESREEFIARRLDELGLDPKQRDSAFGAVDAFVRGAADTISLGFADEIAALGDTAFNGGTMDDNLLLQRGVDELDEEVNPAARIAGQVAGGVALPVTRGAGSGRLTAEAAGYGAGYGFGSGEGDIVDRLQSGAVGATTGAITGYFGGKLLDKFAGKAPKGASQSAQDVATAKKFGIDLPMGATGRTGAVVEKGLDVLPGSAGVMQQGRENLGKQVVAATDDVASQFGPATSFVGMGDAAQRGAKKWLTKFEEVTGKAYDAIPVSPKAPTSLTNTQGALENLTGRFQSNPKLADAMRNTRLDKYMDALGDKGSQLSWEDLKAFRSRIGEEIGDQRFSDGTLKSELRSLYGALSEDMKATAAAQGPEALRKFERANDLYRKGQERIDTALVSILGDDSLKSAEKAASAIQLITRSGRATSDIKKLAKIRASIPKEEWGEVSNGLVRLLGQPANSEGREFSAQTFIRNYDDMGDAAKNLLFGDRGRGDLRKSLDEFAGVVGNLAANDALRNTSGTAGAANAAAFASMIPAAIVSPTAAAALAAQTGGAYSLAKLWTNPRFVQWATGYARMMKGAQKAGGAPNTQKQAQLLEKVAAAEPAIAQDIFGLQQALQQSFGSTPARLAAEPGENGGERQQ